ncbi:Transcription factor, Myb superfamily [Plasmopara halstedii]|uniref:Transcription factor, Myb superfamily n=1 Tax=Plasmopara halstedii TaxID=4781 RepID=A0A0P1AP41_PLAHL|nr:Transcription factor, Myb superfamily [Plasmopara halstedii]CEG43304.1 Transcription factor, Myb superfamily [Plasmopara halstedii]|eukprot:XP_024579673.1 Transcription factor, Myb superfamily [Plasmopara halstedii]
MATVDGSPGTSVRLTELGKALDQASISSVGAIGSPVNATEVGIDEVSRARTLKLPAKSPKKRGRTDSLKKMLPAPVSQRHKQIPISYHSGKSMEEELSQENPLQPQRSQAQPAKLMVKDRKGSGMGVPQAHLILNAVKQAPPAKEKSNPRRWSKHEDESLRLAVERSGERNWKAIADQVPGRNHTQCLQRWTKVLKPGLIKGHWTPEEDLKLRDLVAEGKKNWGQVASLIPGRTSKQCRERWCNHLDPNINKGSYTEDEDRIIMEMQAKLGNRWSIIAQQLKGRTEDAVKIRWKSLMRGRRAALKEDKTSVSTAVSPIIASGSAASSSTSDTESHKLKSSQASPTLRKNQISSSTAATINTSQNATVKKEQEMNTQTFSRPDIAAVLENSMQNVSDLVAASIHNFQMSQRYHPSSALHAGNAALANNLNQLMPAVAPANQQSPVVYAMNDGYNASIQQQQLLLHQNSSQHQQMAPSFQYPPGFTMQQQTLGVMPNYGLPTNISTSNEMQMQVSTSMRRSLSMPLTPTYSSQVMAMALANVPYQHQSIPSSAPQHGFSGAPLHPRVASLSTPSGTLSQPMVVPPISGGVATNSGNLYQSNIGVPSIPGAAAAAAGAKGLNTPREEWGSSQTPRSRMIMTEGHASAYELFHQQRLRLMLQERDKQGMTLSSAPSPGQALLTKELEANKERQARQAIMQKGWKSAVESMVSFNSVSDLSALEDQQRYDGLLEKVSLSALDPTDDEMLDQTVEIISGDDTVDL